ncbi:MAG: DUF3343 domain-containing protein [Syntrophomonas sp.]
MSHDLLKSNNYCLITFNSTSQALKAEKILKEFQAKFIIIPTLREISTSCGLSIKVAPDNIDSYFYELIDKNVTMAGVYRVEKEGNKNTVKMMDVTHHFK